MVLTIESTVELSTNLHSGLSSELPIELTSSLVTPMCPLCDLRLGPVGHVGSLNFMSVAPKGKGFVCFFASKGRCCVGALVQRQDDVSEWTFKLAN